MKQQDREVFEALETLAASLPWDSVDIWVRRRPEGEIHYTAIANENRDLGFPFASNSAATAMEAVTGLCQEQAKRRDPELSRKRRLQELAAEVARLQALVIGIPPYRPNRELAEVNPIQVEQPIDV